MNTTHFYERYWQNPAEAGANLGLGLEIEPRKALLKQALRGLPAGAPVLDAGCGSGVFTSFLIDMGFAVTGIDISQTAVAYAQAQCPRAQFQVAMLEEKLPFADEAFAAIWCTEVVEHLFDVHAALAELNRVLRPGGKLILTTPHHGLLKNLVIATIGFDKHYNPYLSHIRFFTRRSLSACLEHAGFAVDQWRGIGRRWPVWKSQFVVSRKLGMPGPAPEIIG